MGHQIIKQPNGKYAVWSSVVDQLIGWDQTKDQIIEYYADRAAKMAREETIDTFNELPTYAKAIGRASGVNTPTNVGSSS